MTDNEIIAEFMGAAFNKADDGLGNIAELWYFLPGNNPNPHCKYGTYKRASDLVYHERWDWLMPVVEKIAKMNIGDGDDDRFYPRTFGMIDDKDGFMVRLNRHPLFHDETLIGATYQAVVYFIKAQDHQNKN